MLVHVGVFIFVAAFVVAVVGAFVIRNVKLFAVGFALVSAITLLGLWGVVDGVYSTSSRLAERVLVFVGGVFLAHPVLFVLGGVAAWFSLMAVVGMNAGRIRAWAARHGADVEADGA